jgi:hypothetical protein
MYMERIPIQLPCSRFRTEIVKAWHAYRGWTNPLNRQPPNRKPLLPFLARAGLGSLASSRLSDGEL